jgi:hypothetical protein
LQEKSKDMDNWQQVLIDLENSGQSIVQYCREHDLKPHNIRYWKQKLRRQQEVGGFVSINTTSIVSAAEIFYPNGVRLKLSSGYSLKDLKALIDV